MNISKRGFFSTAVALAAAATLSIAPAHAQSDFPNKPIKLVVGYSAGGPTDVIARLLGQDLTTTLGQPVIVDNKAGANGNIATTFVAQASADGYTLLVNTLSHNVNPLVSPATSKYDPVADFAPVSLALVLPQVIIVGPDSPYKTVGELVAAAKAKPGVVTYGSAGVGGSAHLAAALLEQRAGVKMNHIPFKGNGPAMTEVMAGRVDFMFYPMIGVADRVAQKQLKVIAVTPKEPHPDYPGVPTMADSGFKGFEEYVGPVGFLAPAGTPEPVLAKLSNAVQASLKNPATQDKLKSLGAIVVGSTPQDYAKWLKEDHARWAQLVKDANLSAE